MILFLRAGEYKKIGEVLVKEALSIFEAEEKIATLLEGERQIKILRTATGKPYFQDVPVCFSISHTAKLWGCLMATFPVGLDIQEIRHMAFEAVAQRVFLPEEQCYIKNQGILGFFQVWVRKEACVKYFGTGIGKDFQNFSVVQAGELIETVTLYGQQVFLRSIEIRPDIQCAICSKEKDFTVWTKVLK